MISIITPVYNRPELLKKAIQSALSQTHADFEYIVVDDASTEDVKSVVEGFRDDRLKYIRNPVNKMMAATYNVGIRASRGEYVAFLESDDQWLPTKLEKQMAVMEKNKNAGVVYCGRYLVDSTDKILRNVPPPHRGKIFEICLREPLLPPTVLMIRRQIGERIGWFDAQLPGWNDWDMLIRLSKATEFDFCEESLVKYLIHPGQLSGNILEGWDKKLNLHNLLLTKHRLDYDLHPQIQSELLRAMGWIACCNGRAREGRKYFFGAVRADRLDYKNYRALFLSLFGSRLAKSAYLLSRRLLGD